MTNGKIVCIHHNYAEGQALCLSFPLTICKQNIKNLINVFVNLFHETTKPDIPIPPDIGL